MASLPSGYTQLEYIESTGTQWIDLKQNPNQNSSIELKFELTSNDNNTYGICGCRNSSTGANGALVLFKINSNRFDAYIGNKVQQITLETSGIHIATISGTNITIDDLEYSVAGGSFTGDYSFLISAVNQLNGVDSRKASIKIYYAKGTIETNLNLVPCKNSSNEVGLYDLIYGTFYPNAGTGTFIAGPEVAQSSNMYVKINNVWQPVTGIYTKTNNTW